MQAWRAILGLLGMTLVILLLAFSFNAYACLLPVYGGAATSPGSPCSTNDEQPARQFCDTYKTLGVPAGSDMPLAADADASLPGASAWSEQALSLPPRAPRARSAPTIPPRDLHVTSSVLRL